MTEVIAYSVVGFVRKQLGYGGDTLHNHTDPHTLCLVRGTIDHNAIVTKALEWQTRWLARDIATNVIVTDTEIAVYFNPAKFTKTPGVLRISRNSVRNLHSPHIGWTFSRM